MDVCSLSRSKILNFFFHSPYPLASIAYSRHVDQSAYDVDTANEVYYEQYYRYIIVQVLRECGCVKIWHHFIIHCNFLYAHKGLRTSSYLMFLNCFFSQGSRRINRKTLAKKCNWQIYIYIKTTMLFLPFIYFSSTTLFEIETKRGTILLV